jgi:murein endopeptidase
MLLFLPVIYLSCQMESTSVSALPSEDSEIVESNSSDEGITPSLWKEPYFPFFPEDDETRSISIGTVTEGFVVNANALPSSSQYFDILPRQKKRNLVYGTDEVIDLIDWTAQQHFAQTGQVLWLGNIGKRGGGDIPYSVSHNSGRDFDMAFCYRDQSGKFVVPPDLVSVDSQGVSIQPPGEYIFDVECTYSLVKNLFAYEGVQIKFILVSTPLKKRLLAHAKTVSASSSLIEKIDTLLFQPGRSPHNDHLHVRVYCSEEDVGGGCNNIGKIAVGASTFEKEKKRVVQLSREYLTSDKAELRQRAIQRLVLLRSKTDLTRIGSLLTDPDAIVRKASAIAISEMGSSSWEKVLIEQFQIEKEPTVRGTLVEAIRNVQGTKVGTFLTEVLDEPAHLMTNTGALPDYIYVEYTAPTEEKEEFLDFTPEPPRWKEKSLLDSASTPRFREMELDLSAEYLSLTLLAIEKVSDLDQKTSVQSLIELLRDDSPLIRLRTERALQQICNTSFEVSEESNNSQTELFTLWSNWYAANKSKSRNQWLIQGFNEEGFEIKQLTNEYLWALVRAIASPKDHISYNAQKILMRITDHRPQSLYWSKGDASWHWTVWLRKNKRQFNLNKVPTDLIKFDP